MPSLRVIITLVVARALVTVPGVPSVAGVARAEGGFVEPAERTGGAWRVASFIDDANLTGRFILDIDFSPDGTVWLATADGLQVYDGYRWRRYSTDDGLPSDFVRSVRVTRNGRAWIGTNRGVAILDPSGGVSVLPNRRLAGPNVRRIVEDPDGTLWFCSDTWLTPDTPSGLTSYHKGEWTTYGRADGLPSDYVSDYFRDSQGRQFVLTRNGLAQRRGDRWFQPLVDAGLPACDGYFWTIAESPSAGVMVATDGAYFTLRAGSWSRYEITSPYQAMAKIAATSDGEILTVGGAPDATFLRWNGARFVEVGGMFRRAGDLQMLKEAPDGSIWCIGYNFISRWARRSDEWTEFPTLPKPILADRQGQVWFAGDGVGFRLADGGWEPVSGACDDFALGSGSDVFGWSAAEVTRYGDEGTSSYDSGLTGVLSIDGLIVDAAGNPWLHGHDEKARRVISVFDGSQWTARTLPELQGGWVSDAAADASGAIWLVLGTGPREESRLVRVDRESARAVAMPHITDDFTPRLHADYNHDLWLHGHFGLYARMTSGWRAVEGLPGAFVRSAVNGSNATWFVTSGLVGGRHGLARWMSGEWCYLDIGVYRTRGLTADSDSVFFTRPGEIYRTGAQPGRGISRLSVPADGDIHTVVGGQNGTLWIGVDATVLRYRADSVMPETEIVHADHEVLEGEAFNARFVGTERFKPRGSGVFEFSWRIDSRPWSPFSATSQAALGLSLRAGVHTFEVRARDEGLDVDSTPVRRQFHVHPLPIQARVWFWPLVGAVFCLLAVAGIIAVLQRNRVRYYADNLENLVTERSADLRESEERFRAIFNAAGDAIFFHDANGAILDTNDKARELYGYSREEMRALRVVDLSVRDDLRAEVEIDQRLADALKSRRPQLFAWQTKSRSGRRWWTEVLLQHFQIGDEDRVLGIVRDITDRKRAEQERQRLQRQLWQAQKMEAVGTLAAGVAHDFNNLITAIVGYAEIARTLNAEGQDAAEPIEGIEQVSREASDVTKSLLAFSRKPGTEREPLQLGAFVVETAALLKRIVPVGIEISTEVEEGVPLWVQADETQLRQVVVNLAVNARDAMPAGGTLRIAVGRDSRESGPDRAADAVVLTVEDSGIGMSKDTRDRIFEPFFTTKTRGRGTGLGMAVVHGIITEHHGTVEVRSQPDTGTCITIVLPPCVRPTVASALPDPPHAATGGCETIILAEDNPHVQRTASRSLRSHGFRVLQAASGTEAMATFKTHRNIVRLIILDIDLPEKSGIECIKEIRADACDVPILVITGSLDIPLTLGQETNVAVLPKPFRPLELSTMVQRMLSVPPP